MKNKLTNQFLNFYFLYPRFDASGRRDIYSYYTTWDSYSIGALENVLIKIIGLATETLEDYTDSISPYEEPQDRNTDFKQPVFGLGNTFLGLVELLASPLMLALDILIVIALLFGKGYGKGLDRDASSRLLFFPFALLATPIMALARLTEACVTLLRGLTQLATTPLTWLLKIPLRSSLSKAETPPNLPTAIEDRPEIKSILRNLQDNEFSSAATYRNLHRLYRERRAAGGESKVMFENSRYEALEKQVTLIGQNTSGVVSPAGIEEEELKRQYQQALAKPAKTRSVSEHQLLNHYPAFLSACNAYHSVFFPAISGPILAASQLFECQSMSAMANRSH